jgi:hypothetical protein
MKSIFSFVLILLASMLCQAQNSTAHDFNLPPGVVLQKKGVEVKDLSYKLTTDGYQNNQLAQNFLKKFSEQELNQMEKNKGEDYLYYKIANEYFLSLSDKVRKIYTYDELWYIYMFDKQLKEKLTTIK